MVSLSPPPPFGGGEAAGSGRAAHASGAGFVGGRIMRRGDGILLPLPHVTGDFVVLAGVGFASRPPTAPFSLLRPVVPSEEGLLLARLVLDCGFPFTSRRWTTSGVLSTPSPPPGPVKDVGEGSLTAGHTDRG